MHTKVRSHARPPFLSPEKKQDLFWPIFEEIEENTKEILVKICMAGPQAAGKSSIVRRYTKGDFDSFVPATICAEFSHKTIPGASVDCGNGYHVKLRICDTAGQERYMEVFSFSPFLLACTVHIVAREGDRQCTVRHCNCTHSTTVSTVS